MIENKPFSSSKKNQIIPDPHSLPSSPSNKKANDALVAEYVIERPLVAEEDTSFDIEADEQIPQEVPQRHHSSIVAQLSEKISTWLTEFRVLNDGSVAPDPSLHRGNASSKK